MAVRHRRVPIALAAVLVLTGAGVAIAREVPADPPPSWNEAAAPRPSATELPAAGEPAATAKPKTSAAPATGPAVTRARAVRDARTAIRRNGTAIRSAPGEQYRVVDTTVDAAGTRHVRFQRTHRGLAVLGGDFVVHSAATGRFTDATVAQQQVIDVPATAEVDREQAVAAAERFAGQQSAGNARQVIDAFAGKPVRSWEVTVGTRLVIVDATTGTVRRAYDNVLTAEAGTGHGMLVGDVPLSTSRPAGGEYTLVDPDRGGNTVRDGLNEDFVFEPKKFAEFTDADNVWGDGTRADRATTAVDVHYGMAQTWDYLRESFGRSGVRNDGKGLTAYVHHDVDEANAAWSSSCQCVYFGDGAPTGKPFTALDVVGHEVAHGLNYRTAGLVSSGESGGLNESSSDIFGTLVEFAANNPVDPPDYLIGELTGTRAPALRQMDEPSRDGKSLSCWVPTAKSLDPHYSSGIGNKFFYTLAAGSGATRWGDSPPCGGAAPVTGIGNDRAAQIWYRALTVYMVSNTNFSGARDATIRAAADVYGPDSVERRTVDAAWLAAGVDGSDPAYGTPQLAHFEDSTPTPHVGDSVRIQVSARDPQGQPVTFSAANLPPGVSIDADGLITGTPTVKGEYPGDIIATDPDGNSGRELMWWVVKGPPVARSVPPAQTMRLGYGAFGNFSVTFTDAPDHMVDAADSFRVTATGLPAGLTLDVRRPASGTLVAAIGGIPTTAGSGTTVVTATDADGDQVTASVPWQVLPAQPPGAPVSVSVAAGNGTALVEWVRPNYSTGVMVPTGYIVRLSPGQETTLPAAARSLELTGLDVRKTYTIGVRATSAIGDGVEKTITLSPAALPLTVTPSAFAYGKSATLTGKILRGSTAIAGTSATLEQRPAGKTAWTRITTVKTDAKGAWRATVKPSITTTYRIRYAGSPGAWPATSATPAATVRYTATIKASTTKPKANKKIKLTGTAKPGRAGVKVTLQRKSGSKWVTVTTAKTTSSGSYSFTRSFKRGTWTLRVSVAGGTYNAGATSSGVTLKVK
ncbi:M4 family metallopeptidase [Actinoplanes sp. NPDC048967]|uniref:M4 family metallopeptidase n=1 Tax=Actinoplanes sp. NPDC048967 TaxID=3155269 RepID=UPI0033F924F4